MTRVEERGRRILTVVVIFSTLALLYGEGLIEHARFAANAWHFNDDARQHTWPLLRYADANLFPGDYIADYYLAMLPPGYRLLYAASAPFVDPRVLGKILPYVELLLVLFALVSAAWSLAGPAAAWGTGALCLSSGFYLARMAGGLPRSFAFPLVALALRALIRGKPWQLCLLTVLGAAFYYPAGVLIGCAAAVQLLLMPRSWQGDARAWSLPRRLAVLAVTAAAAALLVLPVSVAGSAYGPLLGTNDAVDYPEAGRGGRYDDVDLALPGELGERVEQYARNALLTDGPAWNRELRKAGRRAAGEGSLDLWLGGLMLIGLASLLAADAGARRMLALVLVPFALYELAVFFSPHFLLPARYLAYTLPLLTPLLLPTGLASLVTRLPFLRTRSVARGTIVVVGVVLALLYFGASGPGHAGIQIAIPRGERPLYELFARIPPDAVVAGWPGESVDNVPYLSARRILVGFEVHQAFHARYATEMRRRTRALIDAYFATEPGPLLRLRRELGVTHLLVNRDHFTGAAPKYFKPFDAMIARAHRTALGRAEVLRLAGAARVFEAGPLLLLDLSRIDAAARGSAGVVWTPVPRAAHSSSVIFSRSSQPLSRMHLMKIPPATRAPMPAGLRSLLSATARALHARRAASKSSAPSREATHSVSTGAFAAQPASRAARNNARVTTRFLGMRGPYPCAGASTRAMLDRSAGGRARPADEKKPAPEFRTARNQLGDRLPPRFSGSGSVSLSGSIPIPIPTPTPTPAFEPLRTSLAPNDPDSAGGATNNVAT